MKRRVLHAFQHHNTFFFTIVSTTAARISELLLCPVALSLRYGQYLVEYSFRKVLLLVIKITRKIHFLYCWNNIKSMIQRGPLKKQIRNILHKNVIDISISPYIYIYNCNINLWKTISLNLASLNHISYTSKYCRSLNKNTEHYNIQYICACMLSLFSSIIKSWAISPLDMWLWKRMYT